jgi:hypothetical protein
MADEVGNAESGRRQTGIGRRFDGLRRFPLVLFLSVTLSAVFVVFVAGLIAFMQYQARLSRAQPGITASQLVYWVETETKIEEGLSALGELSEEISEATPEFTYTSNEINFRIERICALFNNGPEAKKDTGKCREYLNQIPFNATDTLPVAKLKTASDPANTTTPTKAAPPPEPPIPADVLSEIMDNFVAVMGAKKFGNGETSKLVKQFSTDLSIIARLNQKYSLTIRPEYLYKLHEYSANCQHLNTLIATVSTYRIIDSGCTPDVESSSPSTGDDDSAKPAAGGSIVPAPSTGSGNDTQGAAAAPPAAGGAIAAPATGGQAPPSDKPPESIAPQGGAPGKSAPAAPAPQPAPGGAVVQGGAILPGAPAALSPIDRQHAFELVTSYRFYDRLSRGKLKDILISPNDFLALVLVCFAGILGALLRIIFASYVSGKDPTLRSFVISPILGLICSLVIYNLFRAGFIVITDQPQNGETAALSPFVIALLAMAAGLLSERTVEFFRKTSDQWLGSVEASQAARWAVNLQRELDAQSTTAEKLAQRLDVSAAKLRDWAQEKEPVPGDKQRDIAFALNVSPRQLFTDLEPVRNG